MEIRLFHVQIVFCSMFQIKRKKVEEYLLTIYVFVYLCVKFKFRYLRSNTHTLVLNTNTLHFIPFIYLCTFFKSKAFQIDLCGFYRFMAQ